MRDLVDFPQAALIHRDATIRGDDDEYRYDLTRIWDPDLPVCAFIMLNPSTADGKADDATINKCMRFAFMWGYGGIVVVNLFAWRATDPKELRPLAPEVAIGPLNDDFIEAAVDDAALVICAWGSQVVARQRAIVVTELIRRVSLTRPKCLRIAKGGAPWHPLYVPYAAPLIAF